MRVPTEILLQILEYAVQDLPFSDLFRARLVNTTFANEIFSLVLETSRIEDDGFCKKDNQKNGQRYWAGFPDRIKHQYLYKKVKDFPASKCTFAFLVLEILDNLTPEEASNEEEKDQILRKLISVTNWQKEGFERMLYQDRYNYWHGRYTLFDAHERRNAVRACFQNALLCSAIKLGDCDEIRRFLEKSVNIAQFNHCIGATPLFLAAEMGSREVVSTLNRYATRGKNGYYMKDIARAMAVSALRQNKEALDVWIEQQPAIQDYAPSWAGWDPNTGLDQGMWKVAKSGDIEMIDFILDRYSGDQSKLRLDGFVQAVKYYQVDVMEHFIKLGGFDLNGYGQRWPKGALYTALHDFEDPSRMYVSHPSRAGLVRFLLEKGVSPNTSVPRVRETALQWVLGTGSNDLLPLVEVLLEYGADANAKPHPRSVYKLGHPLFIALKNNQLQAMRLLLEKGANPNFLWRRKTLLDHARHWQSVDDVKAILIETGWAKVVEQYDKRIEEKSARRENMTVTIGECEFLSTSN